MPARAAFCVRLMAVWTLALGVVLGACQSILGIDSDRPLVTASGDSGPTADDSGPVPQEDSGGGLDASPTKGADGGDGGVDATITDSAAPDGDAADVITHSGPATSLTNPVQVDMSSLFTNYGVNTVVTTTEGGVVLTPMDGPDISLGDNNDFPTVTEVLSLGKTQGLPNDGFFPSNGATIPNVQLAWNNSFNGLNSIVTESTAGTTYQFNVPQAQYSQIQIYATGGGGQSTLNYTLTYMDMTTTQGSPTLPDWCTGVPGLGQYVLVSVYRVQSGTTLNNQFLCNIYALDLNPNPSKVLSSVTFSDTGSSLTTYLVFYGATAW